MKFRILIEQDENGLFVAECPSLPGCVSQGETRDNAIENIKGAIIMFFNGVQVPLEPIPPSIEEETVEVYA